MVININVDNVFSEVQRHLAMIGKRTHPEIKFSAVTLSTRERIVFFHYTSEAVRSISGLAPERVMSYAKDANSFSIHVIHGRDSDDYTTLFTDGVLGYVLNYCLAQYLSMNFPELAKKYIEEADISLADLRRLLFRKDAPTGAVELTETIGQCSALSEYPGNVGKTE